MDRDLARRFGSMSSTEVAALDRAAGELGVSIVQLMEAAGSQVARMAWRMLARRTGVVLVVAGHGHNGCDGLVAARYLAAWGCAVAAVVLAEPEACDSVMSQQITAARGAGVEVRVTPRPGALTPPQPRLVIDAVLGTGFAGPLRPGIATVLRGLERPVLSIDVPSGVNANDGAAAADAVRADVTLCLAAVKRGLWDARARSHAGAVHVADIGIPPTAWARCGVRAPTAVRGGGLHRVPITWTVFATA